MTARERAEDLRTKLYAFARTDDEAVDILAAAILAAQSDTIERCAREAEREAGNWTLDAHEPRRAAYRIEACIRALNPEDVKP
jgi:hypothetical protein